MIQPGQFNVARSNCFISNEERSKRMRRAYEWSMNHIFSIPLFLYSILMKSLSFIFLVRICLKFLCYCPGITSVTMLSGHFQKCSGDHVVSGIKLEVFTSVNF